MIAFLLTIICIVYLCLHYRESENKTGPLQFFTFLVLIPSLLILLIPNSQPKAPDGVTATTGDTNNTFIDGHTYTVDKVSFFSANEQDMIEAVELLQSDVDRRDELEKMKWSGKIIKHFFTTLN